ncbi:MAG: hypothetical protein KGZ96_12275 [Clostridia bacterium]|nr:hypothetical protein [Clostridia bacterium]
MHSRKKNKQKADLFFSDLIPHFQKYQLKLGNNQFPVLTAKYDGYIIKMVPEMDGLSLHSIPRLYLRMYIYKNSSFLLRLHKWDKVTISNYFFKPNSFENHIKEIMINHQKYHLHLSNEHYPIIIEESLQKFLDNNNNCAEILLQNQFIRLTILLSRGNRSSYIITRAAIFPSLILKWESFERYFRMALDLHEEVNKNEFKNHQQDS